MQNLDRKSIISLLSICPVLEANSSMYAKELHSYLDNALTIYSEHIELDEKEKEIIKQTADEIFNKIKESSSWQFVIYSLILCKEISEYFINSEKHVCKLEAWTQINDYCSSNCFTDQPYRHYIYDELNRSGVLNYIANL